MDPTILARRIGTALLYTAGVAGLCVLVVAAVVLLLGGNPVRALAAILAGSVGSPASAAETLLKTTPLVFTGLAVAVAFRCGIWNIGAEGQFLLGMLGSTLAALFLPPLPAGLNLLLSLAAGTAAGALWASFAAFLRLKRDVPEVISTIMLNFLAVYLIGYLVRSPIRDPGALSDWSPMLPAHSHLPRIGPLVGYRQVGIGAAAVEIWRLHLGVLLALGVALLVWLWLSRSGAGFRIRAVGLNPAAAATAGIPVGRTVALAFVLSGALAGLGGAVEILGLIQRMYRYEPGSPGYGFSGIAVALLGQLGPPGVLLSALFFGALSAGCNQMQRAAGISFHVAYVIQAAVVLLLVSLPRGLRLGGRLRRRLPGTGMPGAGSLDAVLTDSQSPGGQSDGTG